MATQVLMTDGLERIDAARDRLTRQSWGDGVSDVCMMNALLPGTRSVADCVTAGWPSWMAELCVALFDAEVGAENEIGAAYLWARHITMAVAHPVDYDVALAHFVAGLLMRANGGQGIPELKRLHDMWRQRREEGVVDLPVLSDMAKTFQRLMADTDKYIDEATDLRRMALNIGWDLSSSHPDSTLVTACRTLCELKASQATSRWLDDEWHESWDSVWHRERGRQRLMLRDSLLIGSVTARTVAPSGDEATARTVAPKS